MKLRSFYLMFAIVIGSISLTAQEAKVADSASSPNALSELSDASEPDPKGASGDFEKHSGANEFGFWGGYAPVATSVFGGLHKDETSDRQFVLFAFRYGRTLTGNQSTALQYTLDAVPLAIETGNIVSSTTIGTTTTFQRKTTYGWGVTPLGLQLDFRNSSKIKPFVHINAGMLIFNRPTPLPDAGKFAFTLQGGGGIRIFTSSDHAVTLGVRLHHISNGNLSGSNRGLNQFVMYAGFSIFK